VSGWAPYLEASTWLFLGGGLLITLRIAVITVLMSFVLGTLLAFGNMSRLVFLRLPSHVYVMVIRGIPVFLIILCTYFGLGRLKIHVSVAESVTIALVIYTTAYISETVRGAVLSIAQGQIDAARSLGLTRLQALRHVVLPQAFRITVPALVNRFIIAITGTSIGAVVGLDELLRRSQILYNGNQNPLQTLTVTGLIYFVLLYSLSRFSKRFELSALGRKPAAAGGGWWARIAALTPMRQTPALAGAWPIKQLEENIDV